MGFRSGAAVFATAYAQQRTQQSSMPDRSDHGSRYSSSYTQYGEGYKPRTDISLDDI
jgi:hypothetical protein